MCLCFWCVQIRPTRSRCLLSKGASSCCVWMEWCPKWLMTCTAAAPPPRCFMEEAAIGTVAIAGSTRHCRWQMCMHTNFDQLKSSFWCTCFQHHFVSFVLSYPSLHFLYFKWVCYHGNNDVATANHQVWYSALNQKVVITKITLLLWLWCSILSVHLLNYAI